MEEGRGLFVGGLEEVVGRVGGSVVDRGEYEHGYFKDSGTR